MNMNKNEIITLSFGEYSNYVNSHFWNLATAVSQNSTFLEDNNLNMNILFSDSGNPRSLIYDSSENIRSYFSKNDKQTDDNIDKIYNDLSNIK